MENVKKLEENTKPRNFLKIIKGSVISIVLTLVLLLITTLILTYTNVSENIIPTAVIAISAISILIGSVLSSMNIKKNGLVSSLTITGFTINIKTVIMLAISIVAGIIGGIIGVNIHK